MRKHYLMSLTAVVLGVCLVGTYALSQEKAGYDKAPSGPQDEMIKAWEQASKPGPHHKALEAMAGNFKYVNKFKMDPSAEWTTSEGEYSGEMIMDGKFLAVNVKGPMMGMDFNGMGVLGYDNTLKKHVSGWIDNMGTGVMRSEGTCDGACKTITFEGDMIDPMTGKPCAYKYVYEIQSNDNFTMRWWSPSPTDGKMFESMVINYTRVK